MINILPFSNTLDVNYLLDGYYGKNKSRLIYLALSDIEIFKLHDPSPDRCKYQINFITNNHYVHPIVIADYDKKINKYILLDGNHRCYCAKILGYTHIPSVIENKVIKNSKLAVSSNYI